MNSKLCATWVEIIAITLVFAIMGICVYVSLRNVRAQAMSAVISLRTSRITAPQYLWWNSTV